MKKFEKGFVTGIAATLLVSSLGVSVFAAYQQQATLTYNDIKITLDGTAIVPKDVTGKVVEPFIIDGTTYLPVRGIASAMDLDVDWNADTMTVLLESPDAEVPKTETPKVEIPEEETPKVEVPKVETPKEETPKVETPKVETPKAETPKEEEKDTAQEVPQDVETDADFAQQILDLVNIEREKAGIAPMVLDDDLSAVALAHSQDMALHEFFAHTNLDGKSPFDRMDDYGIDYRNAAENIAAGRSTAELTMTQWMNSPGHKANILNASYNKLGVGHYYQQGSTYRHYWTQCFTN